MSIVHAGPWSAFDRIDIDGAARALAGVVRRTPLSALDSGDARVELRGKLETRQETGSFKARGAWNQIRRLTEAERKAGVVCPSSGNHGKAVAWAAQKAGVRATIVMPADAYPNKIAACRELGAEVVLAPDRAAAETMCAERVARGVVLVHPYDAERTIEGQGTVGLEIALEWPEVEVVLVPVGGGGLASGTALALRRRLGDAVKIYGVEPTGAPGLARGLAAGKPVILASIESRVQGLTPRATGQIDVDVCRAALAGVLLATDEAIYAAQARLVAAGETVEPAGAAACAAVYAHLLPDALFAGRTRANPLRVAAVVSGGNAEPAQLAALRATADRERMVP